MELKHYPESDMLYLGLAEAESVEGEEVTEGVVFHYDAENRIVSIEIDEASRRVNLKDISQTPELVVDDSCPAERIYTTTEIAEQLGVTNFAVQKLRKAMKAAGIAVGIRPDLADSLMSEEDLAKFRKWREEHPRGRPRTVASA